MEKVTPLSKFTHKNETSKKKKKIFFLIDSLSKMQDGDLDSEQTEINAPQSVGPYRIIEKIGSGAFAAVFKAVHTVTSIIVALKCIPKEKLRDKTQFELLQREVKVMRKMDHPFIVPLFEVLDDDKNFYIVIEYVENGNLLDHINESKGLQEEQAKKIFYQIITAIEYLHEKQHVMHRDLKAENVLLDRCMNIRLADFGLSKAFSKAEPFLQSICGSPHYVSPEIINEKPYSTAADIWSAGVLLYAMVVGVLPFHDDNLTNLLQSILSVNPFIPHSLSPELRDFLTKLLVKDPKLRIKIPSIKQHPWMSEYFSSPSAADDMKNLKIMEVQALDTGVVTDMRAFGYDVNGLLQELQANKITARTAAYKILKRQRGIEEINNWQLTKHLKSSRKDDVPILNNLMKTSSSNLGGGEGKTKKTRQPRMRKRVNEAKKNTEAPLVPLMHLV